MSPADLSRLPWPLTWSCSCFSCCGESAACIFCCLLGNRLIDNTIPPRLLLLSFIMILFANRCWWGVGIDILRPECCNRCWWGIGTLRLECCNRCWWGVGIATLWPECYIQHCRPWCLTRCTTKEIWSQMLRALDWFRSYLSNRTQSFCITSEQSAPVSLPCSVPQGSRISS